ncbi:archease [Halapricum hydrolyticum]|uniref:Archease n=1 Tax=Halapricum hydrolyticum TaxID=2979991 RepID=A0AAE3IEP2_9EURY|nr:archease [Halapricum hydrolyticum]MCU4719218.1 archease [Halapricum hydrolyticum]MCU4728349.1 archease [Halapricum hydrolyticum]
MSYELREHTADVAVEATGKTIDAVFGAVADGLAAAMYDDPPEEGDRFELTRTAESREALLFDYLDELIYQRDVRGVLPVGNEATVRETSEGWTVEASARGVPLSLITAREVKAVTYSEMQLERTDGGWRAYVVFDV